MKLLGVKKYLDYLDGRPVGFTKVYIVSKLPKVGDSVFVDGKTKYVVSFNEHDDLENVYSVYLEDNLGDWDNQIIEVCDVINIELA